ncbi:hypothetical protein BAU01nite_17490 [Brevibacterium aurantiacum]|nr:hypothetical protein BAU01nite_17490 [Brevibacterium aurantiacum]
MLRVCCAVCRERFAGWSQAISAAATRLTTHRKPLNTLLVAERPVTITDNSSFCTAYTPCQKAPQQRGGLLLTVRGANTQSAQTSCE